MVRFRWTCSTAVSNSGYLATMPGSISLHVFPQSSNALTVMPVVLEKTMGFVGLGVPIESTTRTPAMAPPAAITRITISQAGRK